MDYALPCPHFMLFLLVEELYFVGVMFEILSYMLAYNAPFTTEPNINNAPSRELFL
jgi:hypothetical protein